MKNIWIKYKLAIIILSYVLVVSLVIYFLELPLAKNIKNTSSKIQEKLLDQQICQNRLSKLPQMAEDMKIWQSQKKYLETILASNDEVGFIENLDAMADQTGNTINLQIGNPVNSKKITKTKKTSQSKSNSQKDILNNLSYKNYFPMEINLKGNYAGLVNFIHKLENFNFYVNIISLDIKKEKVMPEKIGQDQSVSEVGLFSTSASTNESQENVTNSIQKEILDSDIKVIVYTK